MFYFKIHQTVPSIFFNIRSNNLGNLEYLERRNIKENVNAYINNYTYYLLPHPECEAGRDESDHSLRDSFIQATL